jgi:hypothetical protein
MSDRTPPPPAKRTKRSGPRPAPPPPSAPNRVPWIVGGAVVVVVVIALVVALTSGSTPDVGSSDASAVLKSVVALPDSVFDAVGTGTATNPPTSTSDAAATQDGKPLIAYVGAEYCPYCAAERWAMVLALSRFGAFTELPLTHSSTHDVFPDTQTFSFHGASYYSDVIAFSGTETQSNRLEGGNYVPLDTPPAQVEALVSAHSSGSIPFVVFGGRYVLSGATYDPGVLHGKTARQIAEALSDPASEIARGAVGSANVLTAAICATTDGRPAKVCRSSTITGISKRLAAGTL